MDKVLKIGIIGCGAIGKDHCRRIIETVPGATVLWQRLRRHDQGP